MADEHLAVGRQDHRQPIPPIGAVGAAGEVTRGRGRRGRRPRALRGGGDPRDLVATGLGEPQRPVRSRRDPVFVLFAVGTANSVTTPAVVIRAIWLASRARAGGEGQAQVVLRALHALWVYRWVVAKIIQIRDVPDDVHQRLTLRALQERRSLSELVRAEIVEIARRPTMAEMLDRLTSRPMAEVLESPADALAHERLGK